MFSNRKHSHTPQADLGVFKCAVVSNMLENMKTTNK